MNKALTIVLVLVLLGAFGALGYIIATPKVGEEFTEFYLLGAEGRAADYPEELVVGEEGKVIVGVVNQEHEAASYRLEVRVGGVKNNEMEPIVLEHGGKWEGEVGFTPGVAGKNQKVEFLLFKDDGAEPYLEPLYLWVDVIQ